MAQIKISQLKPVDEIKQDDTLQLIQDGSNRKATFSKIFDKINTKLIEDGYTLPIVTQTDAGAFLRVNSQGKWAKEQLQNAEDQEF